MCGAGTILKAFKETTVVIAVDIVNLAFGKPATQSSTYLYHSINPVAGYAVDGSQHESLVDRCGC
jgi:hypothetical protein